MDNQYIRRTKNSVGNIWRSGSDGGFGCIDAVPDARLLGLHTGSKPQCVAVCWLRCLGLLREERSIGGGALHELA